MRSINIFSLTLWKSLHYFGSEWFNFLQWPNDASKEIKKGNIYLNFMLHLRLKHFLFFLEKYFGKKTIETYLLQDWVAFMSQPYWVEVDIEAEIELNLRLKCGWDEIESKFSWNWVEVELRWSWDKLTLNKGRNWAFIGVELWFKIFWGVGSGSNFLGYTHTVQ